MLSKIIILRYLHAPKSDNNIILFVVLARDAEHEIFTKNNKNMFKKEKKKKILCR